MAKNLLNLGRDLEIQIHEANVTLICCHVQLFATLWTIAHQAPLSMVFFRQQHWSVLPFPSPGESS